MTSTRKPSRQKPRCPVPLGVNGDYACRRAKGHPGACSPTLSRKPGTNIMGEPLPLPPETELGRAVRAWQALAPVERRRIENAIVDGGLTIAAEAAFDLLRAAEQPGRAKGGGK